MNLQDKKQLMMLRFAAPAPLVPLPEGWAVRPMRPGEGETWSTIVQAAGFFTDSGLSPAALWEKEMGSDAMVKAENVFFACNGDGTSVATASARFVPDEQLGELPKVTGGLGCLHYVAAVPGCRGVGAGSAVSAAVIRRLDELGIENCMLTTDDFRLPAIKSYLRLGWVPVLYAPDMPERWKKVLENLGVVGQINAVDMNGQATSIG